MRVDFRNGLLATAVAACTFVAGSAHAEAVTNGGFETGDFTGWSTFGDTGSSGVDGALPRSGQFAAYFGPTSPGGIQQSLPTMAGRTYMVSFWLQLESDDTPSSFSWSWNGSTETELIDSTAFGYTEFTKLVTATGPTTSLAFSFVNVQSFFDLDDVSVVVQEPYSFALAGVALLGLMSTRRRQPRALQAS